jgi:hypothetical protein
MRPARAFRTIWRINGVLLLLSFALLAVGGLVGLFTSMSWGRHERGVPPAVVADKGERLFIGAAQEVEGTEFVILPLETRGSMQKGISSGPDYNRETRNLIFYNATSGASAWLRPDHSTRIVDYQLLRESGGVQARWESGRPARADPVRWIRYELDPGASAKPDGTHGNGARQIAVSGPGGDGFTVVLDRADEVLGYSPTRNASLAAFFRLGDKYFAADIDLDSRKVRRTLPLPKS